MQCVRLWWLDRVAPVRTVAVGIDVRVGVQCTQGRLYKVLAAAGAVVVEGLIFSLLSLSLSFALSLL